jgi:hypothetical protein
MFLINGAHKSCRRWENLVNKYEDGFLWCKLDTLPDDIDELPNRQILYREQTYKIDDQLPIGTRDKQGDAH